MGEPLDIDLSSVGPLHRQVYEGIRDAILSGRFRPGHRLPATRALAEQLSLSRATITEAYDQLRAEGYVRGRHGSGTYVVPDLPVAAKTCQRSPKLRLSPWGERVYAGGVGGGRLEQFTYDFRPHRVAQDCFPWEDWRAVIDRALARAQASLLSYPSPAGCPDLLEAIADHVASYRGVSCSPDQIVVVSGSQEGLNLLTHLLLAAGDVVVVEDPGYPAARLALEAQGLSVTRVLVDGEGLIIDQLSSVEGVRLVHVTPSHQDPTGATLSLSRRLALLEISERYGSLIFEDDYDSEFRYEGHPVESLQGLDRSGQVVYAGTFSKSVFPGLRLGFLVLPQQLAKVFIAAKSLWDNGSPVLEQLALAEFMRSGSYERHIRRMRRLYRARRDALVAALAETFGSSVTISERHGGLNSLVSLRLAVSADEVISQAAVAGIGLRSASSYYSQPPSNPTFLLGFGALPEERIREGVALLGEVIAGVEQTALA